jgi:Ribosomal protein S1
MNYSNPLNPTPEDQAVLTDEPSFADVLSRFEQEQSSAALPEGAPEAAVQGTVVSVNADGVVVDIGRKMEGILSADKLKRRDGEPALKAGDTILVNVTGLNEEGYYVLSTVHVEQPKDWSSLQLAHAEGRVISGTVQAVVKGGLRVDIGVRAFMPASRSGARDLAEMEKLVGQEIRCKVTKLDVEKEDVVVDRRVVLEEEAAQAREKAFGNLSEGLVVRGTVRSVTDFGAFVDLGGIDGLLHVTDMSWTRVSSPGDIVKVGDSLEVKILKINRDTRKISLGLKQLQPDPWTLALERFKVGDRVHGKVVRLQDFGAFVELAPGVDGLIHVSELSWSKKVRKPSDVVKVGDLVDVVVLGINAAEKRISLGLKQALGDPWDEVETKFPVGSVVEGTVSSLASFGAFVDLSEGIEGMIHIGDISREKRLNHPKEVLSVGQAVRAQVLEIDRERRRIRLGMKQLEPTSADKYIAEHQVGETVTGRVIDVSGNRVKVELSEGVSGWCKLQAAANEPEPPVERPKADLNSLTAMLEAKWKQGKDVQTRKSVPEGPRPGQIRSFRIAALDPAQKRIDLEMID